MNKQRILKLIEILKNETDMEHQLSANQIMEKMEEEGIRMSSRKTLYDDLRSLGEYGYEVEFDKGYYLQEAPFSLSEIKIIIDSINSLKNLDDRFLDSLKKKLYSFISIYEAKDLRKLEYHNRHIDRKFINRLEDCLYAIRNDLTLIIRRNNRDKEEIVPVFIYRQNDYYYLYYHYEGHGKLYHTRFDNIVNMSLGKQSTDNRFPSSKIIEQINESSRGFFADKAQIITFSIIEDSDYLRSRLEDDFPNLTYTKDGFYIRASISDAFFAKLTSYKDQIKISDRKIADQYIDYLQKIITRNS